MLTQRGRGFVGQVCLCSEVHSLSLPKQRSNIKPLICFPDPLYRYLANTEMYLKAVALKHMPPNLQTVDMLKAGRSCQM